jgi:hypothetical protein
MCVTDHHRHTVKCTLLLTMCVTDPHRQAHTLTDAHCPLYPPTSSHDIPSRTHTVTCCTKLSSIAQHRCHHTPPPPPASRGGAQRPPPSVRSLRINLPPPLLFQPVVNQCPSISLSLPPFSLSWHLNTSNATSMSQEHRVIFRKNVIPGHCPRPLKAKP